VFLFSFDAVLALLLELLMSTSFHLCHVVPFAMDGRKLVKICLDFDHRIFPFLMCASPYRLRAIEPGRPRAVRAWFSFFGTFLPGFFA
jgi:hypothetical protein